MGKYSCGNTPEAGDVVIPSVEYHFLNKATYWMDQCEIETGEKLVVELYDGIWITILDKSFELHRPSRFCLIQRLNKELYLTDLK